MSYGGILSITAFNTSSTPVPCLADTYNNQHITITYYQDILGSIKITKEGTVGGDNKTSNGLKS